MAFHPERGFNVEEPHHRWAVSLTYDRGAWRVEELGGSGHRAEINRDVAVAIAEALHFVHPDIIDGNLALWAEADEYQTRVASRLAVAKAEEAVLDARRLKAHAAKLARRAGAMS